jgi:hypothetical protein
VAINGQGRVTQVSPISGPPELLQPSVDAAKQWEFEPPAKAPVFAQIEMTYSLTKPCSGEKGWDAGDVAMTIAPTDQKEDGLEIVDKLYQPSPPCPERVRVQRHRGQLYLSMGCEPGWKRF